MQRLDKFIFVIILALYCVQGVFFCFFQELSFLIFEHLAQNSFVFLVPLTETQPKALLFLLGLFAFLRAAWFVLKSDPDYLKNIFILATFELLLLVTYLFYFLFDERLLFYFIMILVEFILTLSFYIFYRRQKTNFIRKEHFLA